LRKFARDEERCASTVYVFRRSPVGVSDVRIIGVGISGRFRIPPCEPQDRSARIAQPSNVTKGEAHIGAQRYVGAEMGSGEGEAMAVSNEDGHIRMGVHRRARAFQALVAPEMDRLRQKHHLVGGEVSDHALAEGLERGPEVTEVPPSRQQDRSAAHPLGERGRGIGALVALVRRTDAPTLEVPPLAEPDQAVSHVRMVREVEQRAGLIAGHGQIEDLLDLPLQLVDQPVVLHARSPWDGLR
jgi:hypothetical protein